jgi:hypothetical protein
MRIPALRGSSAYSWVPVLMTHRHNA